MMLLSDEEKKASEVNVKWWNDAAFAATRLLIFNSDAKKNAPVKAAKDERSKFQQEQDAKLAEMAERKRKQREDDEQEKENRKKMAESQEKMCMAASKIAEFLTSPAAASADIQMNNPNAVSNVTLSARMDTMEEKLDMILLAMNRNN